MADEKAEHIENSTACTISYKQTKEILAWCLLGNISRDAVNILCKILESMERDSSTDEIHNTAPVTISHEVRAKIIVQCESEGMNEADLARLKKALDTIKTNEQAVFSCPREMTARDLEPSGLREALRELLPAISDVSSRF